MWTKQDYVSWKQTRAENAADWKYEDCQNADQLIKSAALLRFESILQKLDPAIADFLRVCTKTHFGSVECDEMLTKLKCYPDWI